jgi:hypothetical protein
MLFGSTALAQFQPPGELVMRSTLSATLKISFLFVLFATFFNLQAAAQQQWTIVRAEYGYGSQRVDVTQRLRDVARSNTTFRMGNSTFGIDPSPGNVKTLFIFATRNGRSKTFQYREGSTVDGALFSGWGSGNWGPGPAPGPGPGGRDYWQILGARYGTPRNSVDVTQRLRELAGQNAVFRMGNSTFGVDPDKGVVKTLRIYARGQRGETRIFEFREGSTVDGTVFSGWGAGGWGRDAWTGGWEGGAGWKVY